VRHELDRAQVDGHVEDGEARVHLQRVQHVQHGGLPVDVEPAERLVTDQHRRPRGEHAQDVHEVLRPAGELAHRQPVGLRARANVWWLLCATARARPLVRRAPHSTA
jgi:hypothetical protein